MSSSPVFIRRDFLPAATTDALLDYVDANEGSFRPTRVGLHRRDDAQYRISLGTRDLGPFRSILEARAAEIVPDVVAALGMTPIRIKKVELEMVAHGDGAFYARHVDLNAHRDSDTIRALSGVYYFHARTKAFTGGALRLYPPAIGSTNRVIDVEPVHNSFAAFPSWVMHEVMPVRCPSRQFRDARFSINCWVHVARKPR